MLFPGGFTFTNFLTDVFQYLSSFCGSGCLSRSSGPCSADETSPAWARRFG